MHTHALMHTDMGYFPHKEDNISHHSAEGVMDEHKFYRLLEQ